MPGIVELTTNEVTILNMLRGVLFPGFFKEMKTSEGCDPHSTLESLEKRGLVRRYQEEEDKEHGFWKWEAIL
jgi:hypothetical protein